MSKQGTTAAAFTLALFMALATNAEATGSHHHNNNTTDPNVNVHNNVNIHPKVNVGQSNAASKSYSGANSNANSKSNSNSNSNSNANAHGGNANAHGGRGGEGGQGGNSNSSTGPVGLSNNNINNYDAPLPMGNAPTGFVAPSGDCGQGGYLSLGVPYVGLGGGSSSQDKDCLAQRGATATLNAGVATNDAGLKAIGLRTMSKLYPQYNEAVTDVTENLVKDCVAKAASISAALLANPTMNCTPDGKVTVQVPEAPVAP